jgi:hypothetical protein
MLIINYTKTTIHAYKRDTLTSFDDEDWQSITSNLEPGNKVGIVVVFGEGFIVEKTTVSLLYADVVGPVQLLLHDLDQPAEAVAEDICAAEAEGEEQVSLPDRQPNLQAAATPETIGPVLGAQILDALKELRADFARQDQTVTARLNALEVRLEELEDVIAQIPRGSSSIFRFLSMLLFIFLFCWFVFL